jgi:hypothetical protein
LALREKKYSHFNHLDMDPESLNKFEDLHKVALEEQQQIQRMQDAIDKHLRVVIK